MNEKPTYCFIINCASNSKKAESFFRSKESLMREAFPNSTFVYVGKHDSIRDIVKDKSRSFSHIIACGGDGTVNQVVHGLYGTNCMFGVLPLGSGNDFAQSSGIPMEFSQSLNVLLSGKTKLVDLISYNNGFFINTCGIGLDGLTNFYASTSKYKSGFLKYFSSGLKALISADLFTISIVLPKFNSPIVRKVWMATIANGATEGGSYRISPSSQNDDGRAELILVNGISRFRLFIEFIKLSIGLPFGEHVVESFTFSRSVQIAVESPQKVHMDGENVVLQENPSVFEFHKGVINVLVP